MRSAAGCRDDEADHRREQTGCSPEPIPPKRAPRNLATNPYFRQSARISTSAWSLRASIQAAAWASILAFLISASMASRTSTSGWSRSAFGPPGRNEGVGVEGLDLPQADADGPQESVVQDLAEEHFLFDIGADGGFVHAQPVQPSADGVRTAPGQEPPPFRVDGRGIGNRSRRPDLVDDHLLVDQLLRMAARRAAASPAWPVRLRRSRTRRTPRPLRTSVRLTIRRRPRPRRNRRSGLLGRRRDGAERRGRPARQERKEENKSLMLEHVPDGDEDDRLPPPCRGREVPAEVEPQRPERRPVAEPDAEGVSPAWTGRNRPAP